MATITDVARAGESQIASTQMAALTRLDLQPWRTAVFAASNFSVFGPMQALAGRGRRFPEDLAIAGFNEFIWAEAFRPRLTVSVQSAEQMAHKAVALLFDGITKRRMSAPVGWEMMGEPIVRASCGASQRPHAWRAA